MKIRIATALAVAGVLFAGSAAALVNSQVLGGHDRSPGDSVLESPTSVPATVPRSVVTSITVRTSPTSAATIAPAVPSTTASAAPPPATVTVTVAPTAPAPAPAPAPPAAAPAPAAYAGGESGTVVLDGAGGSLVVVTVAPSAGWQVVEAEPTGPATIRVVFRSGDLEVTFDAALDGAGVVTAVDAQPLAPPTTTRSATTSRGRGGGDDDRDDGRGGRDD